MSKLLEILKIESQEIATSFAKASIEGEGTAGATIYQFFFEKTQPQ